MLWMSKKGLHHRLLVAALVVVIQDLSTRGGAHAWSYNYNTRPNRRWEEARRWCQAHYTDMVSIQNQEEADFLHSLLPPNNNHYWIAVHRVGEEWIWANTNQTVPDEAQNWATDEPDSKAGKDCVEIYIHRSVDTTKWNDENCLRRKGTVCYTASCAPDSCSAHADCVETIGNFSCLCHPGFQGPNCEEAIACDPLLDLEQGSHDCFDPFGSHRFNSSCSFHCELGFQLVGAPQLLCQASGRWSHPVPLCQVRQCQVLNDTSVGAGRLNCSHPIAPYSYNSTCELVCHEGHEHSAHEEIRCEPTGQWTASVPACTKKQCPPILFPAPGNVTCVDAVEPFSFGSNCSFTCREGFHLTGDQTLGCLASGQWSGPTPACTVVQCTRLQAPPNGSLQCQDPLEEFSYSSLCTVSCEEGYDLIGTNATKCSSQGNWSHSLPVCQVKRCDPINSPSHGSLACSDPNGSFSFGSQCTSSCEEGFLLNGTATTECSSKGEWSADVPVCQAKRCPSLTPPPHAYLVCSDPNGEFSFGSRCSSVCDEGFVLNGTAETHCNSQGLWGADSTQCLAQTCPTLISPTHGSLSCSGPHGEFRFGSKCKSTCGVGFVLNGTADTECTSRGKWSRETPSCLALPCPLLAGDPQHGKMTCSHPHSPFSYGSRCDFTCKEGFWLRGKSAVTCNNSGHWSKAPPTCQPVQCGTIQAFSSRLSMNCSHPLGNFSFGSHCVFTCKEGFSLNGSEVLHCSSTGSWSDRLPKCTVEGLPLGMAMLIYTGVGAASVIVPIILIVLTLWIMRKYKRKGNAIINDEQAWDEQENPAFEF